MERPSKLDLSSCVRNSGTSRPVERFVSSCITADLPSTVHLQSLLRRLFGFSPYRAPCHAVPTPLTPQWESHTSSAAERTQPHVFHPGHCHKGLIGEVQCALAMPRSLCSQCGIYHINGTDPLFTVQPREGDLVVPLDVDPRVIVVAPARPSIDAARLLALVLRQAQEASPSLPVLSLLRSFRCRVAHYKHQGAG